jgi:hypothetical protein
MLRKFAQIYINPEDAYDAVGVLGPCPEAGLRNPSLLLAAIRLRNEMYEPEEAFLLLGEWLTREPRDGEIERVIEKAWADTDGYYEFKVVDKKDRALPVNHRRVLELYREYAGYDALLQFLQTTDQVKQTPTAYWLRQLYQPDDLLCIGCIKFDTDVAPLSEWLNRLFAAEKFPRLISGLKNHCFLTPAT